MKDSGSFVLKTFIGSQRDTIRNHELSCQKYYPTNSKVNTNDIREIDVTRKNNTPSVLGSNLEGEGGKINYNENGEE